MLGNSASWIQTLSPIPITSFLVRAHIISCLNYSNAFWPNFCCHPISFYKRVNCLKDKSHHVTALPKILQWLLAFIDLKKIVLLKEKPLSIPQFYFSSLFSLGPWHHKTICSCLNTVYFQTNCSLCYEFHSFIPNYLKHSLRTQFCHQFCSG